MTFLMASSSSSFSTISHGKYDIFLSFRGENTRDNFTSHLYHALSRSKIRTFFDEVSLKRGDEISPMLLKAIEESKISVIIFSKDYASSRWCLDELAKILECKKMNGQMIIPVFINMDPSDVRKQAGSFEDAFINHEERFKQMEEKVQRWRDALTEVANISGWNSFVIKLPYSKLQQLWKGTKHASKLKLVDLHESQCLTRILDLSYSRELEVINLRYCKRLRIFPHIAWCVRVLDLSGTAIREIPTSICELKSLHRFKLWDCSKLERFPEILENMEHLQYLSLDRARAIKELPSSIEHLIGLRELSLMDCKSLVTIPSSICNMTSLHSIYLNGCSKFDKLPENIGNLIYLRTLHVKGTAITQLPSSVSGCKKLGVLNFSECRGLVLPLLSALVSLRQLSLTYCNLTEVPEDLCCVSPLEILNLSGNNFRSLPTSFKQLSRLKRLWISNCKLIQSLPELPTSLVYLEARNCKRLQSLPELPSSLEQLSVPELDILSECCCSFAFTRIEFLFTNCLKLNQKSCNNILADSWLRTQHMTTASLRLCYEKVFAKTPSTSFCLPGSEVPDWFSYQSSGSSVTIELPQDWCNRRFIGFVLCAVIGFEGIYCGRGLYVRCSYQFQTNYNHQDQTIFGLNLSVTGRWPISYIDSEHIVLGYSPFRLVNRDYKTATFNFIPSTFGSRGLLRGCKVTRCGVCPLYAQTSVIQPNISIEKLAPVINGETVVQEIILELGDTTMAAAMIKPIETGYGRVDGEKVKPGAKRICR